MNLLIYMRKNWELCILLKIYDWHSKRAMQFPRARYFNYLNVLQIDWKKNENKVTQNEVIFLKMQLYIQGILELCLETSRWFKLCMYRLMNLQFITQKNVIYFINFNSGIFIVLKDCLLETNLIWYCILCIFLKTAIFEFCFKEAYF